METSTKGIWGKIEQNEEFQAKTPKEKLADAEYFLSRVSEKYADQLADDPGAQEHFRQRSRQFLFKIAEDHFPNAVQALPSQIAESASRENRGMLRKNISRHSETAARAREALSGLEGRPDDEVIPSPGVEGGVGSFDKVTPPHAMTVPQYRDYLGGVIEEEEGVVSDRSGELANSFAKSAERTPSAAMLQLELSEGWMGWDDFVKKNWQQEKGAVSKAVDLIGSVAGAITGTMAESAIQSGKGAVAGMATTLATGSPIAGGAVLGAVAMDSEYQATYLQELQSELQERGGDVSSESIRAVLSDPEFNERVDEKARTRGLTIGATEGVAGLLSFGIANKIGSGTMKKALLGVGSEAGIGAVGGSGGEFLARLFSGDDIWTPEARKDILTEGVAELGQAGTGTATAIIQNRGRSVSDPDTPGIDGPATVSDVAGEGVAQAEVPPGADAPAMPEPSGPPMGGDPAPVSETVETEAEPVSVEDLQSRLDTLEEVRSQHRWGPNTQAELDGEIQSLRSEIESRTGVEEVNAPGTPGLPAVPNEEQPGIDSAPSENPSDSTGSDAGPEGGRSNDVESLGMPSPVGRESSVASPPQPREESFDAPGMESLNLAAVSQANPNRIAPDPLQGPVKPNREVLFDVAKSIGLNIHYKGHSRRSIGTYYPGSSKVAIRYEGDLDTAAHEIAHALDDRFGIVAQWAGARQRSPFDAELQPFAATTSRSNYSLMMRRAEGVAEWVRAWLVNPDEAAKAAPKFTAHFEKMVPEATRNDLRNFGDDIRRFAGATAAEQILANVRYRPDSNVDRLRAMLRGGKPSGFEVTYWDKLSTKFTDRLRPFEKAVQFAREQTGADTLLPKNDPVLMARLLAGHGGVVEDVFENGMVDAERNRVTPGGIKWLLEPFEGQTSEEMERSMRDAIALMIAERTVEMSDRFQRKDLLTGIGAGVRADLEVAEQAVVEFKSDPDRYAMLQEAANRYRQWANANLRYLRDKGRISGEAYDAIVDKNQHYVALQRLIEAEPGTELESVNYGNGGNLGSVAEPIRRLKGSTKTIDNPYTSLIEATNRAIKEADRNEVLANFVELLETGRSMYGPDITDIASVGTKTSASDVQKQTVYRNGKPEHWRFDADIQASLKGLSRLPNVPGLFTWPAKILRAGITNAPQFAIRNFIRDTQSRWLVSQTTLPEALRETMRLRGPMDMENLRRFGGDQAGHYLRDRVDYTRAMDAAVRDLANDPKTILVSPKDMVRMSRDGWDAYSSVIQKAEQANRLAEYRGAYRKAKNELGYSDYDASLYAAAQARDLIDFAVAGEWVRYANQVIPFLNAAVQGMRRNIRAGRENPTAFFARWMLLAVVPTVMFRAIVSAMGDDEEYEQLPDYIRDMFWNFKVGDDTWLRIPKNFETGVLASSVDRAISSEIMGENRFGGYGESLAKALLPIDEVALGGPFKSMLSTSSNYDFFRKSSIVPHFQKDVDLDAVNAKGERIRKTDRASRLGKGIQWIAENVGIGRTEIGRKGFDARTVDFLLRDVAGIAGDTVARLSNIGRDDTNQKIGLRDVGLFTTSPAWAAKDVQEAFDLAARRGISTQSKTFENLNSALDAYFEAKTSEDRDRLARAVRRQGKETLDLVRKIAAERGDN